ncbi:MAG TPA: 5-deoxy-glucuronate isomerase [Candidatus Limnocylindrales bacterium]|nr:5-deoxy-glucuronate isomerase [Candidatus Limnocylindrales bacterium]
MPQAVIHGAAVPSTLSADELHLRSHAGGIEVDPPRVGWRYLSFRALHLDGSPYSLDPALEHAVVVIAGAGVTVVDASGDGIEVAGRPSPFDALPSACYVPAGEPSELVGSSSLVAIASSPTSGRSGVARARVAIRPSDVRIEIRGAGNATRQINHIISPDFPADRLEVVEVLTPSGNWSSWPPHKHDVDDMPAEAVLEEVYYYQFRRREAWGIQRLYRRDRSRDHAWEVRAGEAVLVTDGYHPFVASHGDDAYYLNALAGDRRTMACSFDPDYDWVRGTWGAVEPDTRVPLVR